MSKPELKDILHVNFIRDTTKKGLEIYCRKKHKLCVPTMEECARCEYFRGVGQGEALECEWKDIPPYKGTTRLIDYDDRKHELLRVSQLIDDKIITK